MSEGYQYTNAKLLSHYDILGTHTPIYLVMGITNRCDMRCTFCVYHNHSETSAFISDEQMDAEFAATVIKYFASQGGKAINFSGGGEPTIYPQLGYLTGVVEGCGLEWGLITNGTGIDRVVGNPTWVRISINAGSAEVWRKVTNTVDRSWYTYIGRILDFVAKCKESNIAIGSSFITYYDNYLDIVKFTKLCKDMGMDYVRLTYAEMDGNMPPLNEVQLPVANNLFDAASELSDDRFKVITQKGRWDEVHDTTHKGMIRCYYAEHVPFVGTDGWLYPCCQLSYIPKYRIRNLHGCMSFNVSMNPQACPPCTNNAVNYDMGELIRIRDECIHRNFI